MYHSSNSFVYGCILQVLIDLLKQNFTSSSNIEITEVLDAISKTFEKVKSEHLLVKEFRSKIQYEIPQKKNIYNVTNKVYFFFSVFVFQTE